MMTLSKNLVLLTFLYFIQGLPYGFQARFLPIYLRTQGTSLTNVGFFKLLLAPWLCKAIWAPLIDRYKTKRDWLQWSIMGLVFTCLIGVATPPNNLLLISLVVFLLNLCASTQDIAVDGIAISLLPYEELALGNTAQVVGYKIGSIFGGGILVYFIDVLGWTGMFIILAALYIEALMFVYISPSLRHFGGKTFGLKEKNEKQEEIYNDGAFEADENDWRNPPNNVMSNGKGAGHDSKDLFENSPEIPEVRGIKGYIKFMKEILNVPGTKWMMAYVLIYKLGEQGALGMLPLYLVDKKVPQQDIAFWTGIVGQAVSIFGSLFAGYILTKFPGLPLPLVLQQANLIRLMPMGLMLWVVTFWSMDDSLSTFFYYSAIICMNLMLIFSGMITTATFTFMMQCSQCAKPENQATHYTILATLEVAGKLLFMAGTGWLVDIFGYSLMYLIFTGLGAIVSPWFMWCPPEMTIIKMDPEFEEEEEETAEKEEEERGGGEGEKVTNETSSNSINIPEVNNVKPQKKYKLPIRHRPDCKSIHKCHIPRMPYQHQIHCEQRRVRPMAPLEPIIREAPSGICPGNGLHSHPHHGDMFEGDDHHQHRMQTNDHIIHRNTGHFDNSQNTHMHHQVYVPDMGHGSIEQEHRQQSKEKVS